MQKWRELFISLLGILLLWVSYLPSVYYYTSPSQDVSRFQSVLSDKEKALKAQLQKIHQLDVEGRIKQVDHELKQQYDRLGLSYFIFHEGELAYWSEDATAVEDSLLKQDKSLLVSENGVHEKLLLRQNDSLYVGLILIKNSFSYENRFLENQFQSDFQFPQITGVFTESDKGINIAGANGENLLSLKIKTQPDKLSLFQYFIGGVGIIGFLLILIMLPRVFRKQKINYHFIAIALALILRLMLFWKLPLAWQDWSLFQSNSFALSFYSPSLGDFLLHISLAIFATYHWIIISKRLKQKPIAWLNLLLATCLSSLILNWIDSALSNSIITYDLNNLIDLSVLSYLSFFGFALLFFIPLLLLENSIQQLSKVYGIIKTLGFFLFVQFVVFLSHFFINHTFQYWSLWLVVPAIIFLAKAKRKWQRSIGAPIILLLCISLLTAFIIRQNNKLKEGEKQKLILQKLAEEKDPVAEYLFVDLQEQLRKDLFLKQLVQNYWERQEEANQYLREEYFNGFWEKYSIVYTPCTDEDSLYLSSGDTYTNCRDYFMERLRREGEVISSTNFFQLQNFPGQIEYLAEVEIPLDSSSYTLFIEFSSNLLSENQGYPELLLDAKSREANLDLSDYSYAIYEAEELVYHHGAYNYSNQLKVAELSSGSFYKYGCSESRHLAYQKDEKTTLVLSHPTFTTLNFLTSWAYLFVLFSVLFSFCCLSFPHFPFYFNLSFTDFSTKIQFFLIGSLLVALVLFSLGTTYYIQEQYQAKNFKNLSEKLRSVNVELEQKIAMEEFLAEPLQPYIAGLLIKFSNVFYSDINLYDKNGRLYASSRPEVFEKGLKSRRMDPIAFEALVLDQKSEWVQEESIGEMNYLSAYIPFRNYDNQVLAYLNLPYFSKQNELQEEISSFLVSTINIYVGIFTLALLVSVLLINQLSKPLLLIRKQIGRLKLGSSVELINWKSQDEIGALVQEYNRIAIELNESAEQLAQSEREGAWREMAKQVAHEIKNPLTPMKLSIQHLQRAAESNPEQFKERLQKTTQTLIEQIDTLSKIANAFSTFAKLPEKELQPVDLVSLLQNTTHLYDQEVEIVFHNLSQAESAIVEGDKDQLLRLFNNLIKNAVHAIQEREDGKIELRLKRKGDSFLVEVEDNGMGIPKEQQSRIFEPNFTTKSSGTGLGLAMAKNIVKHMNGEITFTSEEGEGTTFLIKFFLS